MAVLERRLGESHLGSWLSGQPLSVLFNAPVQQLKPGLILAPGRGDQTRVWSRLRLRCSGRGHGGVPWSPANTSSIGVIQPLSGLAEELFVLVDD